MFCIRRKSYALQVQFEGDLRCYLHSALLPISFWARQEGGKLEYSHTGYMVDIFMSRVGFKRGGG